MGNWMLALGRGIGLTASAVILSLWVLFLTSSRFDRTGVDTSTYAVVYLMMSIALLGLVAAWKSWPHVMLLVFFLSFVPMGFYLLGALGIFFWIGVLNFGFLVSGILLRKGRRAQPPEF